MLPTDFKEYEHYEPPDILKEEISPLYYAILNVGELYRLNRWHIQLAQARSTFYIDESSVIWGDIPRVLEGCIVPDVPVTWFELFEQGREISIAVEHVSSIESDVSLITLKEHPS